MLPKKFYLISVNIHEYFRLSRRSLLKFATFYQQRDLIIIIKISPAKSAQKSRVRHFFLALIKYSYHTRDTTHTYRKIMNNNRVQNGRKCIKDSNVQSKSKKQHDEILIRHQNFQRFPKSSLIIVLILNDFISSQRLNA